MKTEKLAFVEIIGLQKDKTTILDFLHEKGILHLHSADKSNYKDLLKRDQTIELNEQISSTLLELKWLKEKLQPFSKKEKEHSFTNRELQLVLKEAKLVKNELRERIEQLSTRLEEVTSKITRAKEQKELLSKIPFKLERGDFFPRHTSKNAILLISKKNTVKSEESSPTTKKNRKTSKHTATRSKEKHLQKALKDIVRTIPHSLKETPTHAILAVPLEYETQVLKKLKVAGHHIVTLDPLTEKDNATQIRIIEKHIKELCEEEQELIEDLQRQAEKHADHIDQLFYELTVFHERYEASNQLHRTKHTFVLEGYVSERELKQIEKLHKVATVSIISRPAKTGPSKLKNNRYTQHFEFITKMFGYPPYRGIDPTIFVSIFLPLFFGFMFSDVGYGILLLFVSLLLLVKATPRKKIVYDSGFVLLICSLSTILFGIFFGSFFGNLFGFSPLLFDPFKNAKTVLITALVLGLLHLNVGILLSILSNLEKKDYRAIITGNLSIVFLELGVALLFLESTALGILALLMSGILFIANTGIMGLMDITGFIGTWFSYARLLALSLATGGIALGINIMAEQLNHIALLGPILFILLLIFGHLFNFAMNVLGSSIHSVRLHYIEFFSQFYEGGGTPFTPYTTKKTKDTL